MSKTATLNVIISTKDSATKALYNIARVFRKYGWAVVAGYLGVSADRATRFYMKRQCRLIAIIICELIWLLILITVIWWLVR